MQKCVSYPSDTLHIACMIFQKNTVEINDFVWWEEEIDA